MSTLPKSLENTFHTPALFRAMCFVTLSLFLLFFYFLSVHIMGMAGLIVFFVVLWIARLLGIEFFIAFLLVSLFLQNVLISSVTTSDDPNNAFLFSMSQGTSFFITCFFFIYSAISWLGFRKDLPPENNILLRLAVFFSFVVIAYSGLGLVSSDLKSVLSYLREYLGAIMFLCIGIAAGYRVPSVFVVNVIRVLAVIIVVWGIAELCFTREVLEFFNVLYL